MGCAFNVGRGGRVVRRGRVLAAALRQERSVEMATEAQALLDWSAHAGALRLRRGLAQA
jgi:hypothetical protein